MKSPYRICENCDACGFCDKNQWAAKEISERIEAVRSGLDICQRCGQSATQQSFCKHPDYIGGVCAECYNELD